MPSRIISSLAVIGAILGLAWGWRSAYVRASGYEVRLDSLRQAASVAQFRSTLARTKTDTVIVAVRAADRRIARAADTLTAAIRAAEVTLADSAAVLDTIRSRLGSVTVAAREFQAEALTYRATVDSLLQAHIAERQTWAEERAAITAIVDEQAEALDNGRCSNILGPCPTRRQSFLLGVVVAVVGYVLL